MRVETTDLWSLRTFIVLGVEEWPLDRELYGPGVAQDPGPEIKKFVCLDVQKRDALI